MNVEFPVSGSNLISLIPQKHPFVFIDSLESVDGNQCTTRFQIKDENVLSSQGKFSIAGLLENMAQSAGCKMGYEDFMKKASPRVGFIGEIRDFEYSALPHTGSEILTQVTIENEVFGFVTVMSAKIFLENEEIASCRMKVFFSTEEKG